MSTIHRHSVKAAGVPIKPFSFLIFILENENDFY
jgi:hypothetical protein